MENSSSDITNNNEYLVGPTIYKGFTYTFPVHAPIVQDFKFTVARDEDSIWVTGITPTTKEDDNFTLTGAL